MRLEDVRPCSKTKYLNTFLFVSSLVFFLTGCPTGTRQSAYMKYYGHTYDYNRIKDRKIFFLPPVVASLEDITAKKRKALKIDLGLRYYENEAFTYMDQYITRHHLSWQEVPIENQSGLKTYLRNVKDGSVQLSDSIRTALGDLGAEFIAIIYDVNYIEWSGVRTVVDGRSIIFGGGKPWSAVRVIRDDKGRAASLRAAMIDLKENKVILAFDLKHKRVYDPSQVNKPGRAFTYNCTIPTAMQLLSYRVR